ncbi:MAG: hypothetical protein SynsKO_33330 [Synoicihabitans sp.]
MLGTVLFLSGCLEVKEDYTINADRSGKLAFSFKKPADGIHISMGGETLEGEAKLTHVLKDMLNNSEGVTAWADVQAQLDEEDNMLVSGVAYFDDIQNLIFKYGALRVNGYEVEWTETDDGRVVLGIGGKSEPNANMAGKVAREDLTDERIEKEIVKQRRQLTGLRGMMEATLGGLKIEKTFRVAAEALEVVDFKRDDDGRYRYATSGDEILVQMKSLEDDEEFMRLAAIDSLTGEAHGGGRSASMAHIVGAPARLVLSPAEGSMLFDYAAEVAGAKAKFAHMMTSLGLEREMPGLLPPEQGGGFKSFDLGGVQFVKDLGLESRIRPFHADPGVTLSFTGRFDGRINSWVEARIERAIDQAGNSLLPMQEHKRMISHGRLNEAHDAVTFEVPLNPHADSTEIRHVVGTAAYEVAHGTENLVISFASTAADSEGSLAGVSVRKRGKADWGDDYAWEITLPFAKPTIRDYEVYQPTGKRLETSEAGSSWTNDQTTLTLHSKTEFPETLELRLEIYRDIRRVEVPFEYHDIPIPLLP